MLLAPHPDTLLTMARKVYEASNLNFLNVSFSTYAEKMDSPTHVIVWEHDDEAGTVSEYERVTIAQLVASYIGLSLELDLDANDAVTRGHRLGNTGR